MKKKIMTILMSGVLCLSLCVPTQIFAGNIKDTKPQTLQEQMEQTLKKELNKKQREAKARKMDFDTLNQSEVGAYQFLNVESTLEYQLCGGIKYYTSDYAKKMPEGLIKLTVQDAGTLTVSAAEFNSDEVLMNMYDKDKRRIGAVNGSMIQANVQKGDVYYFELPKTIKLLAFSAVVYKDHQTKFSAGTMIQSGTGKSEYRTFKVKKRAEMDIVMMPVTTEELHGTFYMQKLEKGTWKNIDKKIVKNSKNPVILISMFVYGLTPGTYRFANISPKNSVYMMMAGQSSVKKKYAVRKKNAVKIKNGSSKEDIFTNVERRARWYKMKRTTIRKKNQYILVDPYTVNGKIKVSIYKKGIKKALKTKVINSSNGGEFKFKPKQGVGTYYLKIQKIGKRTNGSYEIENNFK